MKTAAKPRLCALVTIVSLRNKAWMNWAPLEWILAGGLRICEISQEDIGRILELTRKYRDRPMDFADATLLVIAERTSIRKIISLDSDFDSYRLPGKVRIENVFGN